jgi:hypothetical protein
MHTAHIRRTAHVHTRGSSAAAHGHSADTSGRSAMALLIFFFLTKKKHAGRITCLLAIVCWPSSAPQKKPVSTGSRAAGTEAQTPRLVGACERQARGLGGGALRCLACSESQ